MKQSHLAYRLGFLAFATSTACVGSRDTQDTSVTVGTVSQAQSTSPTPYLYLRCNTTGWNVDGTNRLVPTDNPNIYQLSFEIRDPAMITNGDSCILTETPEKDGWGTWQKYYSTYFYASVVPGVGTLRSQEDGNTGHFKVRYPELGRYQALVNWQERHISITKEAAQAGGSVAWTSPGNPVAGKDGSLYRSNYVAELDKTFVSRVNLDSPGNMWVRDFSRASSLASECMWKDLVVLFADGMLRGIDASTGQDKWTSDLGTGHSGPSSTSPIVTCHGQGESIYFTYSDWNASKFEFGMLKRQDGGLLWSQKATSHPIMVAFAGDHVVVQSHDGQEKKYQGHSTRDGAANWTRMANSYVSFYVDSANRLFMSGGEYGSYDIARINAATGAPLWSRTIGTQTGLLDRNEIYVHDSRRLTKLDSETGRTLFEMVPSNSDTTTRMRAAALGDNRIGVQTIAGDPATTSLALMDSRTGQTLWTRTLAPGMQGQILQDKQGRAYLAVDSELWAVDQATGETQWTYRAPQRPEHLYPSVRKVQAVVDDDGQSLYVSYAESGYRCNPMGITALDKATGAVRWDYFVDAPLWFSAVEAKHLYGATGCMGPSFVRAFTK